MGRTHIKTWFKALLLILCIVFCQTSSGQQEGGKSGFLHRLFSGPGEDSSIDSHAASPTMGTFIVPVLGHSPESGYEFGLSGYKNFLLPSNAGKRISTTTLKASLTTKKSANFIWDADMWADQNRSHLYVELRDQKYPLYYYGIGNHQPEAGKVLLDQRLAHLNLIYERMVLPSFYIGGNFLLERQHINHFISHNPGGGSTTSSISAAYLGLGLTTSYDNRDNVLYTHSGCLIWAGEMVLPAGRGGLPHPGSLLAFNFRYFVSPMDKITIGYDLEYQDLLMKAAPFYILPELGNDERMRGYYAGRSRDHQLFSNQVECRYHFVPRFGVVAFAGVGSTSRGRWSMPQMKPSLGMGCRYFFDIKHNSTIRFDYAWGERFSHESRQKGYYLTLGEAF